VCDERGNVGEERVCENTYLMDVNEEAMKAMERGNVIDSEYEVMVKHVIHGEIRIIGEFGNEMRVRLCQ